MKKSEMMKNWKEVSSLKADFVKALGNRFPHICYTDEKLLGEIKMTLTSLTKKISAVKDGKPEVEPKAENKSKAEPKAKATKVGETTVKTGVKIGAKAKSEKVSA